MSWFRYKREIEEDKRKEHEKALKELNKTLGYEYNPANLMHRIDLTKKTDIAIPVEPEFEPKIHVMKPETFNPVVDKVGPIDVIDMSDIKSPHSKYTTLVQYSKIRGGNLEWLVSPAPVDDNDEGYVFQFSNQKTKATAHSLSYFTCCMFNGEWYLQRVGPCDIYEFID